MSNNDAGKLIELLFGLPYELAVVLVSVLVLVYVTFGGMLATTWVQIIKAILLMIGGSDHYSCFLSLGYKHSDLYAQKKEAETYAKFLKDQAEANKISPSTYKDVTEASVKLNQDVRDYNNALAAQVLAQSVIDFANGDANLASFTNKIGATVADVVGGFTGELDDPSKLSSTRRAQIALEILTNRNIKEIWKD